jgi:hypothetical protein
VFLDTGNLSFLNNCQVFLKKELGNPSSLVIFGGTMNITLSKQHVIIVLLLVAILLFVGTLFKAFELETKNGLLVAKQAVLATQVEDISNRLNAVEAHMTTTSTTVSTLREQLKEVETLVVRAK